MNRVDEHYTYLVSTHQEAQGFAFRCTKGVAVRCRCNLILAKRSVWRNHKGDESGNVPQC